MQWARRRLKDDSESIFFSFHLIPGFINVNAGSSMLLRNGAQVRFYKT